MKTAITIDTKRRTDTSTDGFSRAEFRVSLMSQNPLRQNISYTDENIFFLEYVEKYGLNHGLVRIFNETIEGIAEFFKAAIDAGKMDNNNSTYRKGEQVYVKVKFVGNGHVKITDRAEHMPHEFLRNKSIHQFLVFIHSSGDGAREIVSVPYMIGCKWCKTYDMSPIELHKHGENAINYRGYFIIEGTPRYFLAHEKIAHNAINVVLNEKTMNYETSLKIKDELNNSVENRVIKGKASKTSNTSEDIYYLHIIYFIQPIETNKIFNQIYLLIKKTEVPAPYSNYADFILTLVDLLVGEDLKHYIIYDAHSAEDDFIKPPPDTCYEDTLKLLFKKDSVEIYRNMFPELNDISHYAEMVISSIFPSISHEPKQARNSNLQKARGHHNMERRDYEQEEINAKQERYDVLFSKALLLMRMIVLNILTEHGVLKPTNRNDVGNKAYMNAAEIFRRDLTRDEGKSIELVKNYYKPKASVAKGEADVFEVLEFNNHFNVIAAETSLSIPRCSHSKDPEIRGVNASHTGMVCPNDTPSNAQVGLSTKQALTASFSVQKNIFKIRAIIASILRIDASVMLSRFGTNTGINNANANTNTINTSTNTSMINTSMINTNTNANANTSTSSKMLSINSVPFALITPQQFESIRKHFKRDIRLMDCAIIEETYVVQNNGVERTHVSSYNVFCDGGRIHRPVYNVQRLIELNLVSDNATNNYLRDRSFEDTIRDGVIEMNFSSEMSVHKILYSRNLINMNTCVGTNTNARFCEIDAVALYGYVSACAPMINHNPGARAIHEPAMAKSALTPITTNSGFISESTAKILHTTSQAPVTTKVNELAARYVCNGTATIMAINLQEGNLEDAYTVNRRWADSINTERILTIEVTKTENERMGITPGTSYRLDRYHDIDENTGLPKIGMYRRVGDILVAKYEENKDDINANGVKQVSQATNTSIESYTNKSVIIETGKDGYVQEIKEIIIEKTKVYRITLASFRTAKKGDKLATRYSQKGVIGDVQEPEDLFRVADGKNKGLIPDLIYSPLSLTSRATPALILELLMGTYAVATGKQVDATPFTMNLKRVSEYNDELVELGYKPWGEETYIHPLTKQRTMMMTGIAYVRILKHTAAEKQKGSGLVNFSAVSKDTRQPSKGGPTGAIQMGYMDTFTQAAHGIPHFITQIFRNQSDRVLIDICSDCGHFCDRTNRDTETVKDAHAAKYCAKCEKPSIVRVQSCWAFVMIYYQLLSVGIKMSMFPEQEC